MSNRNIVFCVIAFIAIVLLSVCWSGLVGHNNAQNWQFIQTLGGEETIRDKSGYYWKGFATVTTYPRALMVLYNNRADEGDDPDGRIDITFNDSGEADLCTTLRVATPTEEPYQKLFHKDYGGNMTAVDISLLRSHQINCLKAAAPLMSASEHQSARKSELRSVVESMLQDGIYKMRKVEKELKDRTDKDGNPITVFATEIVLNKDGNPIITQPSPLLKYNMKVLQYSIEETEYDEETREQFAAKKKSFLAAEKSKAEREQEVQQRLMVIERGLREKAEVEAEANKVKAKLVIEAQQKVEVAERLKEEKETKANMALSVAKIEKEQAETIANKELEVARIRVEAATKEAEAIIKLAEAEEKRIKLAGAITEKERVLAEIARDRDHLVATQLSKIKTPSVIIGSSAGDNGQGGVLGNLINLLVMQKTGILPENVLTSASLPVK